MTNITKNEIYDAVAPDDFAAMLVVERHLARCNTFDKMISATHDHFWDPLDKKYIDFDEEFDHENIDIMPDDMVPAFSTPYVTEHFEKHPELKAKFKSQMGRWIMSAILHGEQGALNLSASLCHVLRDPGAQEYAANQTREEARHVTAFSMYIQKRWGTPFPASPVLSGLLCEIVGAPEVYKKIVGMQMLVEGLAMGAFASVYQEWNDPLARKLTQLVMTDEAFHHKFGKLWADKTVPNLDPAEHAIVEDWAAHCFQSLLFNLVAPTQMPYVYEQFGLDSARVTKEFQEIFTDEDRRELMKRGANIFRVLVKTLWNAGIITDRTKAFYAMYVEFSEFESEGTHMIGDDIAEEGIAYLRTINFGDHGSNDSLLSNVAAE
ncbi:MAG: integral membrane protein [Hyphomonadaceae bacterium]|nr:MAG: integral membrane protein [Hyphomonadaceae bacterium]KAF0187011.1 MAG: integral membrane protein [Hyphomonadaceae bacterium]